MRKLIIGDIHGMYDKMLEALECASYDPEKDELYSVGDLCDRGSNPVEVIDYIYSLPNCHLILGNHDLFLLEYLSGNISDDSYKVWTRYNGGVPTVEKIEKQPEAWKRKVCNRLLHTPFATMAGDYIVVHGGISDIAQDWPIASYVDITPEETCVGTLGYEDYAMELTWERDSIKAALRDKEHSPCNIDNRVFVGHTVLKSFKPFITDDRKFIDIDTGSYLDEGAVTVMDMDSLEYWQSGTVH